MSRINIPLLLPLLLYCVSALVGVAIAYAPRAALFDFAAIGFGALSYIGIFYLRNKPHWIERAAAACVLVSVACGLPPVRMFFHPNSLAGIWVVALPIAIARALHFRRQRAQLGFVTMVLASAALLVELYSTESRGAWVALFVVGVAYGVAYVVRTRKIHRAALGAFVFVCAGLMAGAVYAVLHGSPDLLARITELFSARAGDIPRTALYAQVWRLIQDYFFTGSGLGTFALVYPTYAVQLHVYVLPHAHNIFLQTWLEQGLFGISALLWFVLGFYVWLGKNRDARNWMTLGGGAAATVMLLHGLVDAPFWYADVLRALFFVPFAFAVAGIPAEYSLRQEWKSGAAAGIMSVTVVLIFAMPFGARWYANAASLRQTHIELAQYSFSERLVEYTRRTADYADVQKLFAQALGFDAQDVTANQRLAMLALARREYDPALVYAHNAFARDANIPLTWQLLGDAYLALGDTDSAYAYWSRIADAPYKLRLEALLRYDRVGDAVRAARARTLANRIERAR